MPIEKLPHSPFWVPHMQIWCKRNIVRNIYVVVIILKKRIWPQIIWIPLNMCMISVSWYCFTYVALKVLQTSIQNILSIKKISGNKYIGFWLNVFEFILTHFLLLAETLVNAKDMKIHILQRRLGFGIETIAWDHLWCMKLSSLIVTVKMPFGAKYLHKGHNEMMKCSCCCWTTFLYPLSLMKRKNVSQPLINYY